MPVTLGIDPSLTGTGLVLLDERGRIIEQMTVHTKKLRGNARLQFILAKVEIWLRYLQPGDRVVIEQLAFGGFKTKTISFTQLCGLWTLIHMKIWQRYLLLGGRLDFAAVSPTTRAKYLTGNGRAKKPEVMAAVRAVYPSLESADDNACDAAVLARMGYESPATMKWYTPKDW